MCNKHLCNLVGFVAVYLMLAGLTGCPSTSSDTENLPSQGGSAGQAGNDAGGDVFIDSGPIIICPACDELLTWDTTKFQHSTYGKISTSATWDDSYAWQMLNACPGWSIFDGHEGGIGDTLEIGTCNYGLVLRWTFGSFSSIQLSQGWTGKTDTGLVIGTSYQAFLQTYPDYTDDSTLLDANGYAILTYANGMAIFKSSVLSELTVW